MRSHTEMPDMTEAEVQAAEQHDLLAMEACEIERCASFLTERGYLVTPATTVDEFPVVQAN